MCHRRAQPGGPRWRPSRSNRWDPRLVTKNATNPETNQVLSSSTSFLLVKARGRPIGRGACFCANSRLTEGKLHLRSFATSVRDNPCSKCMLWAMRFSAGVIRDVGAIAEGAAAPEKMRAGECNELQGERSGPAHDGGERNVWNTRTPARLEAVKAASHMQDQTVDGTYFASAESLNANPIGDWLNLLQGVTPQHPIACPDAPGFNVAPWARRWTCEFFLSTRRHTVGRHHSAASVQH